MKKEQLFDAIDKIDDKYVSETENFDPETMKIRVFPMISFVPAALVAASVAAVVLAGYFKVHGNDPLGPEIDNNIVTSITTDASDMPATDSSEGTSDSPENETSYASDEAVSGITGSYFTETMLPVTDGSPKISASPDAGRVSSSPDSHTNAPSPSQVQTASPTHTPSTGHTSSKVTQPVPTGHPETAGQTTPLIVLETTEAQLVTTKEIEMTKAEITTPEPSWYPSPAAPTQAASPSPAAPQTMAAASPSPSPTPYVPPTGGTYAPSPNNPVTSGVISFSSYREAKEYILSDSSFEELRSDGFIYYPVIPDDASGQWYSGVKLKTYSNDSDACAVRSASRNDCRYEISVFNGDDYFIKYSSDMAEYLRKRYGLYVDSTDGEKFFTDSDSGDVYFFVDENHYCKVSADDDPEEVLKFAETLTFGKYNLN